MFLPGRMTLCFATQNTSQRRSGATVGQLTSRTSGTLHSAPATNKIHTQAAFGLYRSAAECHLLPVCAKQILVSIFTHPKLKTKEIASKQKQPECSAHCGGGLALSALLASLLGGCGSGPDGFSLTPSALAPTPPCTIPFLEPFLNSFSFLNLFFFSGDTMQLGRN